MGSGGSDTTSILCVDSDGDVTSYVKRQLEGLEQYEVLAATTLEDAAELVERVGIDCVFSPIELGEGEGLGCLETLRQDQPSLPFVLVPRVDSGRSVSEGLSGGVIEYVSEADLAADRADLPTLIEKLLDEQASGTDRATSEYGRRLVTANAEDILACFDGDFEQVYFVNDAYERVWGRSREKLRAEPRSFLEAIHPEDRESIRRAIEQVTGGEPSVGSYRLRESNGDVRWIEASAKPVVEDGEVTAVVAYATEITERKRHERTLERSRTRFDHVQRFARIGYWELTVTEDGPNDSFASDEVYRIHGKSPGAKFDIDESLAAYHEADREQVETAFRRAVERGEPYDIEARLWSDAGDLRWVRLTCETVTDGNRTRRVRGIIHDVTERKRREHDLAYKQSILEAVVETSIDGILVVDDEGEFVTYNERFVEMWGLSDEIVESGSDEEALQAVLDELADPEEFLETVEYLYDNPSRTSRDLIELTDGREFDRYTAGVIAPDGTYHGRVWFFRDVTDERERERHLVRQNERLEEFTEVVSHDLRNPLSVAEGHLALAREDCESTHLDEVEEAHDRMRSLLDDLLTLARDGTTESDRSVVSLAAICRNCWRHVSTREATLSVETDRSLRAEESRLKQLVENLLHNAVEHGGSDVTVTVGDLPDGFYVEDDGQGIPPDQRDRVFERRYSTAEEGTGFGLSIVQEIARDHGWEVAVTAGDTGGARFVVTDVEQADSVADDS